MKLSHIRIDFGFGIGFDKDGHGLSRPELQLALVAIRNEAQRIFGSFTTQYVFGGWTNPEGRFVKEDGITLFTIQPAPADENLDSPINEINELAEVIKRALRQEAVAITITPCNFRLV